MPSLSTVRAPLSQPQPQPRRATTESPPPLRPLLVGSAIDAVGATFVLTLAAIHVVEAGGLAAAAALANAQMLGYGVGAVATGWLTRRWWLRRVFAWSLVTSIVVRSGLVASLTAGVPLAVVIGLAAAFEFTKAVSITATQAEVVARRPGGVALSWSAVALSIGMGLGGAAAGLGWDLPEATLAVAAALPLALAGRRVSRAATDRSRRLAHLRVVRRAARPLFLGAVVTALAFGPVVLSVGLTTQVAGPHWVAGALLVLHASALLAPPISARIIARTGGDPSPTLLPIIAAMVWGSWALAPFGPAFLLLAQLLSGLALHVFGALHAELLVASTDPEDAPVLLGMRALAWQLSTAVGSALVPLAVHEVGISATGAWHVGLLVVVAGLVAMRTRVGRLVPLRQPG